MEEFLTEKARGQSRGRAAWSVVAAVFGVAFLCVSGDFLSDGNTGSGGISIVLGLACFLPVWKTVRAALLRRQTRQFASAFAGAEGASIRLEKLRGQVSAKDPAAAVNRLIGAGYLRNCTVDLNKNAVLLHAPSKLVEQMEAAEVECPHCGASVRVYRKRPGVCAFCGSEVSFPGAREQR